ncbi:MAG: hypothetical protein EAZ15_02020 [Sphingobacteriales bacterium]|nr:MAG: hypothetical protein EAZ15_02020 [Sphingobacteriales bacterium]
MYKFWVCCLLLLSFWGCRFNPNTQNKGAKYLQGQWLQVNNNSNNDLIEYKNHQYTFVRDSFYLILHNVSKANFANDTCYKKGKWTEFVKGVYSLSGDTIVLKGAYVSKSFRLKKSVCYTTGNFEETLLYQSNKDSVLVLKSYTIGKMVFKLTEK